jgi:uncharacterized cupin superfamily protein
MANINVLHPLEVREEPGFRARRGRIGWDLRTERIGLGVWEIEPGEAAYPLHYHLGEEEVVVVLAGTPSLRTGDGDWRELETGEVVAFPVGAEGAHQIANWSAETARFLAISTTGAPDICVYPESGKIGAFERFPVRRGMFTLFRAEDAVEYHHGERPPDPPA